MSSSTKNAIEIFDRNLLRLRRDRAAATIVEFDFLLKDTAAQLMDRLGMIKKEFPRMLDLGAHHGLLAAELSKRAGTENVFASDISFSMALASSVQAVVTDEEFLPFCENSLDAVVSNLSLQWVNDLPGTLAQIRQALKPDGLFLAALVGGESLKELRACLTEAELQVTGGASPRVSPFIDLHDMAALMQRAGFALPVVDSAPVTVDYGHPLRLMRDLRGMGAGNTAHNRLKVPTQRNVLLEAARLYQEKFGDAATGRVTATFDILYVIGWKPHESQQKPLRPGTAKTRLADALNVSEISTEEKAKP